jgi:hypothetical protein
MVQGQVLLQALRTICADAGTQLARLIFLAK